MTDRWTGWKSFPDDYHGEYIQAPMGPGLYEVCRTSNREQIAFGCTRNVAESLCDLLKPRGLRRWLSFRRGQPYDTGELEYRTWPTATLADARASHQYDPRAAPSGDAQILVHANLKPRKNQSVRPAARRSTRIAPAAELPRQATIWSGRMSARSAP